ncbi:MAG: AAA family ATPase [Candidatus Bathyarchaeota archaeon]|nr:AAA family ATPase [Candidatus Bathyarchaeota archaeon]MDH5635455.1 AAA family ATPase [Candidatus Bathyarchaeota archaeon]MDH5701783.1 AAA family ATPase [Candidatus Bathyarchaeota archaeon]
MLIREVILENFMSYEYARIPFKPGVNVVCGPNGSGKSSMLLGISVALGQSYTERSEKLSDLIRWGKDQGRVTLVLDNSLKSGRRPYPRIQKDQIFLTRSLRRDGKYWFELENRAATKADVKRLLSKFGVDPENMLIIMHQNMVEQFTVLSPQEKLRIVEAAVGFESYRQNVLQAQKKLSRILSQEESVEKLLESAEQTLTYWREQYDRYQQKKQLRMKRRFLERELAWAEVSKREKIVTDLKEQIQKKQNENLQIENETKTINGQLEELQRNLEQSKTEWKRLLEERLTLEREKAKHESSVVMADQTLKETESWAETYHEEMEKYLDKIRSLETALHETTNPIDLKTQLTEIKTTYKNLESTWTQRFNLKSESLKKSVENSKEQLAKLDSQISDIKANTDHLNLEIEGATNDVLDRKISRALLQYRKENLSEALEKLNKELQIALTDLQETIKEAEEMGSRIVPMKSIVDILDEIRLTDGHLAALADVSEDIERMYESYSKLYLELKEKARLVAENREKAMEEVKTRMEAWRTVIQNLLDHVSLKYQGILSEAHAIGDVRLINGQDIEAAGLEIFVGFKGGKLVPLSAYTQSGGERSIATMTFLLALQQHVQSPFRAVDEYDIHMDPKNRELIANLLVSSVRGLDAQYLAITPSQVTFTGKDVHIITVQNVEGTSLIKEVA